MTVAPSSCPCKCIVLAAGPGGRVLACPDCGTIHLALAHVTLRLEPDGLRELSLIVGKAQGLMDEARARLAAGGTAKRELH